VKTLQKEQLEKEIEQLEERIRIKKRQKIWTNKPRIAVRLRPDQRHSIELLVISGKYLNISAFIKAAIDDKLAKD